MYKHTHLKFVHDNRRSTTRDNCNSSILDMTLWCNRVREFTCCIAWKGKVAVLEIRLQFTDSRCSTVTVEFTIICSTVTCKSVEAFNLKHGRQQSLCNHELHCIINQSFQLTWCGARSFEWDRRCAHFCWVANLSTATISCSTQKDISIQHCTKTMLPSSKTLCLTVSSSSQLQNAADCPYLMKSKKYRLAQQCIHCSGKRHQAHKQLQPSHKLASSRCK